MSFFIPGMIKKGDEVLGLVLMNEKAYSKSLENHELWVLHPQTQRLLPVPESRGHIGLSRQKLWIEIQTSVVLDLSFLEASVLDEAPAKEVPGAENQGEPASSSPDILLTLARVIHQRNLDRPEGSYTTHLFQKGEEKIRKKLGEEAVEVLLAKSDDELVYELADLFYHALVLLEEKKIDLSRVFAELSGRAG